MLRRLLRTLLPCLGISCGHAPKPTADVGLMDPKDILFSLPTLYRAFDYDFDAVIASSYAQGMIPYVNEVLTILQKKFKGKPVVAGVYINSGTERRLLTETEFRGALGAFVREINAGRLAGLRIFRCEDLQKHPEYAKWAKEEFSKLKRA